MEQKKKCSKCGEEKELNEFWKSKKGTFGVQSTCIKCEKLQKEKWRIDNKDVIKEKARIKNSTPEAKQKLKEYNLKNADKREEQRKVWYAENYDRVIS